MHPVNKVLSLFRLKISINRKPPKKFMREYAGQFAQLIEKSRGFQIFKSMNYEVGVHLTSHMDYECVFAQGHIYRTNPGMSIAVAGEKNRGIAGMELLISCSRKANKGVY